MPKRSIVADVTVYSLAACVPLGALVAAGLWFFGSVETGVAKSADTAKTILDLRIESAREIRRALAVPIPSPEPLGPIKTKAAHALGSSKALTAEHRRPILPAEARDAFASAASSNTGWSHSAPAVAHDRHSTNF